MRRTLTTFRKQARRFGLVPVCLGLAGCAGFWDEVTSRDFHVKNLFVSPDPFEVLKDSTDGDKRAQALRSLQEPKQHGGSDADQDVVLKVLTTSATSERQPLCRLAAIHALGQFKDPRAVDALVQAFEQAPFERAPRSKYAPETTNLIQTQVVTALGQTQSPAAVEMLVRVVKEPPPASDVTEQEKQLYLDLHLAAVRALGNSKHYEATEALVGVLKAEKDVALRDRAHESLQLATGKKLPPDAQAWEEALHPPGNRQPEETNSIQPVRGLFRSGADAPRGPSPPDLPQ